MSDSNPPNQTDKKDDDPKTVNGSETSGDSQEAIPMDTVEDKGDKGKDLPLEDLDRKKE
jgi:hypothetical protein